MLKQVQHDEDGRFSTVARWDRALTHYSRAEAGLEAVAHSEDDRLYDRALGRHNAALSRLLRTRAPDLAAVARKLDLILRHSVFELSFAESCLAALQRDVRGFAGPSTSLRQSYGRSPSPRQAREDLEAGRRGLSAR